MSKIRYDAKMYFMKSKSVKSTSWHQTHRHDVCVCDIKWDIRTSKLCVESFHAVLSKMSNIILVGLCVKNILAQIGHLYDVSFPSYQRVINNFVDLDLWPIPVILPDNADIIPGYLHIKLCNNRPTFNEVIVWHGF